MDGNKYQNKRLNKISVAISTLQITTMSMEYSFSKRSTIFFYYLLFYFFFASVYASVLFDAIVNWHCVYIHIFST